MKYVDEISYVDGVILVSQYLGHLDNMEKLDFSPLNHEDEYTESNTKSSILNLASNEVLPMPNDYLRVELYLYYNVKTFGLFRETRLQLGN